MNTELKTTELNNCNFIKSILMLLIILYHSLAFWLPNGWFVFGPERPSKVLGLVALWLNSFHVYGFVIVSGYIFCALKFENGRYQHFIPFLKTKTERLMLPYIFTSIVWVIPWYVAIYRRGLTDVLYKYILAESPSQLWFLIMLFNVFMFFYPICSFVYKHYVCSGMAMLVIYGIGIIGLRILPNYFQIWTSLQYLLFFYIGFGIRKYGTVFSRKVPTLIWLGTDIMLFFSYIICSKRVGGLFAVLSLGLKLATNIWGGYSAFILLQKLAEKVNINSKFFVFCQEHSMVIYLFHQQVIFGILLLLHKQLSAGVLVIINFIGAFGVSAIIAALTSKLRITRYLTTGKMK